MIYEEPYQRIPEAVVLPPSSNAWPLSEDRRNHFLTSSGPYDTVFRDWEEAEGRFSPSASTSYRQKSRVQWHPLGWGLLEGRNGGIAHSTDLAPESSAVTSALEFQDRCRPIASSGGYGYSALVTPPNMAQRPFLDFAGSERLESPQLSESSRTMTSNRETTVIRGHVREYVFESGNKTASEKDPKKPKRRGELNERTRTKAGKMRLIGACWRCKVMKNQVSVSLCVYTDKI